MSVVVPILINSIQFCLPQLRYIYIHCVTNNCTKKLQLKINALIKSTLSAGDCKFTARSYQRLQEWYQLLPHFSFSIMRIEPRVFWVSFESRSHVSVLYIQHLKEPKNQMNPSQKIRVSYWGSFVTASVSLLSRIIWTLFASLFAFAQIPCHHS